MHKFTGLSVVVAGLLAANVLAVPFEQPIEDAPAHAVLLRRHIPKGKIAWVHDVHLTLRNRHDEPIWILLRPRADTPLADNGNFVKENGGKPFLLKEHPTDQGKVNELFFFAQGGFIAFHLAPRARVDLGKYPILAWKHLHELEVWEVSTLKLNGGDLQLEKWLPADVVCTGTAVVPDSSEVKWGPLCDDAAYPAGGVHSIKADVIRRWKLPLRKP